MKNTQEMNVASTSQKARVLYIPHGGGPLPLLGHPGHKELVDFLQGITSRFPVPEKILVISAHWEEDVVTITHGPNPQLIYDYSGFPQQAYEITYPAMGNPLLAEKIAVLLQKNMIQSCLDDRRGFDHGLFIPLKLMYPEAQIPCVQLSLMTGLDPEVHLKIGHALSTLLEENILILGSGFSFHNMRGFSFSGEPVPDPQNDVFQQWLIETSTGNFSTDERNRRLLNWFKAPSARYCHPREEHLLPLHVCAGMSRGSAELVFHGEVMGKRTCSLLW